jgi:hypothetical protein
MLKCFVLHHLEQLVIFLASEGHWTDGTVGRSGWTATLEPEPCGKKIGMGGSAGGAGGLQMPHAKQSQFVQ